VLHSYSLVRRVIVIGASVGLLASAACGAQEAKIPAQSPSQSLQVLNCDGDRPLPECNLPVTINQVICEPCTNSPLDRITVDPPVAAVVRSSDYAWVLRNTTPDPVSVAYLSGQHVVDIKAGGSARLRATAPGTVRCFVYRTGSTPPKTPPDGSVLTVVARPQG
jgi:hypothetical protein